MIGVFDSGAGGRFALAELRRLCKNEQIIFLADEKNAPYGNKSESELIRLVTNDILSLEAAGATKVLIACCTASTVWDKLSDSCRRISVPIIKPTAKRALQLSASGKIGVLSTEATRRSGAFEKEINGALCRSAPELVTLAEMGACDGNLSSEQKEMLKNILSPFSSGAVDTLILGCTHFAYFEREIEDILGIPTVNSARIAAEVMMQCLWH